MWQAAYTGNQARLKGLAAQDFKKKGKRAKERAGLREIEAHGFKKILLGFSFSKDFSEKHKEFRLFTF